jgi:uncharacterized protein (DUF849 family)
MKLGGPQPKVVITAALTGSLTTREHCPYLPYTPQEISDEALRAYNAGASVVHIHVREPDGTPTWRPELFEETAERIRDQCPVLLNFSTGGKEGDVRTRSRAISRVKPEMAALNMGSMNYAIFSRRQKKFVASGVFLNPFDEIEYLMRLFSECGVIPELECFDAGHICNIEPFVEMGLLKPPYHVSLIMGVTGGISATEQNLRNQVGLLPERSQWQFIGIRREQWPLVELSLDLGGHIRVGLEDNFYLPGGEMAKSNAELVEYAIRLVRERDQTPASVGETRRLLGL